MNDPLLFLTFLKNLGLFLLVWFGWTGIGAMLWWLIGSRFYPYSDKTGWIIMWPFAVGLNLLALPFQVAKYHENKFRPREDRPPEGATDWTDWSYGELCDGRKGTDER